MRGEIQDIKEVNWDCEELREIRDMMKLLPLKIQLTLEEMEWLWNKN